MSGCSDLDKLNEIYVIRKALVLKGNRQMGRLRIMRFNQVQKANNA